MTDKTIPIQFRLDKEVLKKLQQIARKRAFEQQRKITWQDLIRASAARVVKNEERRSKK